jgi:hypothetical protein
VPSFLLVAGVRRLERGAFHSYLVCAVVDVVAYVYTFTRSTSGDVGRYDLYVCQFCTLSMSL